MKFKFCYEKIFEKTIHEKIDLICAPINKAQNEIIIGYYIDDISNFESNLNEIYEELEKIDILPDITYILFHFFIILLSIYSNIFMYNALLKDNHKKLFFWYFIFSLILIFCCYLVYDLNMGINISYIIRKIGDLSVFESIKIILKDFLNIWKYHIIFFLEFFIPIKYFYLIRKEKKD